MKKTIIFSLLTFLNVLVFGQTFEGKIVYKNTYTSKTPNVSSAYWEKIMGTEQVYFIKKGNYKSEMNGSAIMWQLYIQRENKLYNKIANLDGILWNDCAENSDEVLKVELNKGVTEVLGYKCDELILTCKSGIQKYYFNKKIGADVQLFINHKYGNWYDFLSKSNALPLKIIVHNDKFSLESVAIELKKMSLEDTIFDLPQNVKLIKSPY